MKEGMEGAWKIVTNWEGLRGLSEEAHDKSCCSI